jgi:hypothetical protein
MDAREAPPAAERETLSLAESATLVLEECRTVLPGIQGLFGFQLVVVFAGEFHSLLSAGEQALHLAAIALTLLSIALVMAPAAIDRQTGKREVTDRFVRVGTRLLLWSMVPLAVALCLDFYLVARVITGSTTVAWLAAALGVVFVATWWWLPRTLASRSRR